MTALAVDLMGVGLAQEQAVRLGYSTSTTIAGVGTAQSGGAAIPADTTNVAATTGSGQTAFVLPSGAELMSSYLVRNTSSTAALVYPQSGGYINAASQNASVSIAQNLARLFIRVSADRWISFLAA